MGGDRNHYKNNKVVENLVYCFYFGNVYLGEIKRS